MINKFKKNIHFYLTLFIAFYLIPLLIKDTGSAMVIMLVGIPLICFITSFLYGIKNGFDFIYILTVALLFTPTLFIFYNISAYIYIFGYTFIALLGNLTALLYKKR